MKIYSIQYLRAIAAIGVVLCHYANPTLSNLQYSWSPFVNFWGKYGVDVFFVISGFIISYIFQFENKPKLFLRKRMARIYPTYWQIYLLTILVWIVVRGIFKIQFMPHGTWFVNMSLLPFEYDGDSSKMVIGVAWTLYYEMFFYLIATASLYFFSQPKNGMKIFLLLNVLVISFFAKKEIFHLQAGLILEFIAGFFLMEFFKEKKIEDLFLIAVSLWFLEESQTIENLEATALSLALLAGGIFLEKKNKLPEFKTLSKIGDASFSLYLIHYPLLHLVDALAGKIGNSVFLMVSSFVLVIYLAILNYEKFEKPMALKLKKYARE